ncbi:hypothetical protein NU195Hw_g5706t1 [Hortaea werneckii]
MRCLPNALLGGLLTLTTAFSRAHPATDGYLKHHESHINELSPHSTKPLKARQALPECANKCLRAHFSPSECSQEGDRCWCSQSEAASKAQSCVVINCDIHETITYESHKADTCNLPARNNSRELLAAEWSLFAVALLAVLLRLAARYLGTTPSGWDDVMLLVSMSLLTTMMTLQTLMVKNGLGKDVWTVPRESIDLFLLCQWITILLYVPQVTFVKFSIIFLYLRIFPSTVSKQFRLLCWIIIAAGVAFIIIGLLVFAFACQPASLSWSGLYEHNKDKCVHLPELYYLATCINLSTDVLIFVMPIPKVLKLDALSSRNKLITSIMFLLGLIATVAAGVRIAWVHKFLYTTNFTYENAEFDVLFNVCLCALVCTTSAEDLEEYERL